MFDNYSLIKLRNRLAVEGEELFAHRFRNGSMGMISRADFERWQGSAVSGAGERLPAAPESHKGVWQMLKNFCLDFLTYYGFLDFKVPSSEGEPGPVVGIPSDALLRVFSISAAWQEQYHLGSSEDALFIELATVPDRSALCFGNGVVLPLRLLREGQKVKVLRRSWAESLELVPDPVQTK